MRILGFNFTKINVEKLSDNTKDLKISSKIDISQIDSLKTDLFKTKEELLGVSFVYTLDYNPNFAKVEVKGNIVVGLDSKTAKAVLKDWKDEKVAEDFRIPLFNVILRKASLKLLTLEDEMNIPLHLPLPSFKKEQKK